VGAVLTFTELKERADFQPMFQKHQSMDLMASEMVQYCGL
jgi:hypothetical protein